MRTSRRTRGTGSIDRLPSGRWRIRIKHGTHKESFTLPHGTTKKQAEREAIRRGEALEKRVRLGLPGSFRVSELLQRYQESRKFRQRAAGTRRTYLTEIAALEAFFVRKHKDPAIRDLDPIHIDEFLDWREMHTVQGKKRREPLTTRSIAKSRATLHVIFQYAKQKKLVGTNPVADTDVPKGDPRTKVILTDAEFEQLLAECEGRPMLWLYMLTLGETGVRCDSEALWLRFADVDLAEGFIDVKGRPAEGHRTKSGKSRRVPMTPRLREAMQEHFAAFRMASYRGERSPWVFHHMWDMRRAMAGDRIGSLRRGFDAAVKRASLPKELNQHDLRHRRATVWLREGHAAHLVQKALGHSDLRTTMEYEHLVNEDLLQLVESKAVVRNTSIPNVTTSMTLRP